MLNRPDMLEIIRRLHIDTETEMTRDDLEQILNEELSKPEDQMNAELVEELVQLLEDGASEQAQQQAWKQTAQQLPSKRTRTVSIWMARIAAVLAIAFGLTVFTYKTAEAFHWRLLLRLMRPFAETFMLYSGDQPEDIPVHPTGALYNDSRKLEAPQQYTSIGEAPDTLHGYTVKPRSLPERFTYLQGSAYQDDLTTTITHVYGADTSICIVTVLIVSEDEHTMSQLYEKTVAETTEITIGGHRVTYYLNSDDATMSASWTIGNAQYSIFGVITEAELALIVESTMNK